MNFVEYVKHKNPIGSYRAKLFVLRFNLNGDDTIQTLTKKGGIGKKTAHDILKLQNKYNKKVGLKK